MKRKKESDTGWDAEI